jgi:hypothetical protein
MNAQEKKYVTMLELALMDLMDGQAWDDIQAITGLPTNRCYELENLIYALYQKRDKE